MAAVIGALRAELSATIARFADDMGKAGDATAAFARRFKAVGVEMQKTGAIMSAAITAPTLALGKLSVDKFAEQEDAIAAVNAALVSMGDGAGFTSEQLQGIAGNLQALSRFGDEEILAKVTANMLTFGRVTGEEFTRAQQAALDLSARLGQDLQTSAIQVGKALNDPITGLTALTRFGVAFTDQQKEMIKAMAEAGDIAGAQRAILAELEAQYGGQAQAMAETTRGQMAQLRNAWGDFQEQIGGIVAEVLPPLVDALKGVVDWLQSLDGDTKKWIVTAGAIAAAIGPVVAAFGLMVTGIGAVLPVIAGLGAAIAGLVAASGPIGLLALAIGGIVVAWRNWDEISEIVERVAEAVRLWLGEKLGAVLQSVKAKIDAVVGWFEGMYDAVVGDSWVPDMVDRIGQEFGRLDDVMVVPARDATGAVEQAFGRTADAVSGQIEDMVRTGSVSMGSLREMALGLARDLSRIGFEQFVAGPIRGAASGGANFLSGLLGFGGARAFGGPVLPGRTYLVGERGPEFFVPETRGQVVPAGGAGFGGPPVVNMTVVTPSVDGFRRSGSQIARGAARELSRELARVGA